MNTKTLSILVSLLVLIAIIELVRREKLTFKYAGGWIILAVIGIFFATFDQLLVHMAQFFGFHVTSNFIFFAMLSGFVFLSLLLTIFLCQQNDRNDKMAQKIALLEMEIERLKK